MKNSKRKADPIFTDIEASMKIYLTLNTLDDPRFVETMDKKRITLFFDRNKIGYKKLSDIRKFMGSKGYHLNHSNMLTKAVNYSEMHREQMFLFKTFDISF